MKRDHNLKATIEVSETYGEYLCSCGKGGRASLPMKGLFSLQFALKRNHKGHQRRALGLIKRKAAA